MAITSLTYAVTRSLYENGQLPRPARILEYGEASWYGDLSPAQIETDIATLSFDAPTKAALTAQLAEVEALSVRDGLYPLAKLFYRMFYDCEAPDAIDLFGRPHAIKHDLNTLFTPETPYDVTINNGTAEHIFFAGQVFASMHAATRPGGLMIHEGPLSTGWIDHGFYNFHPTLFFDLAQANGYGTLFVAGQIDPFQMTALQNREQAIDVLTCGEISKNPAFFVAFTKPQTDRPFVVPQQGYYDGTVSEAVAEAWRKRDVYTE